MYSCLLILCVYVGGHGVAAHNIVGPMLADYDVDTSFEGDNTVLMQQLSKAMLSDAQAALKNGDRSFLAAVRAPEPSSINDLSYLLALMNARERVALQRLLKSMNDSPSKNAAVAFGENLDLALDAAWAFIERDVFEVFLERINQNPSIAEILTVVARLFALTLVEKNAAFYLHNRLFSSITVDDVRVTINGICGGLYKGGSALKLVEAFKFPDHVMPPVAFPDYIERYSYRARL